MTNVYHKADLIACFKALSICAGMKVQVHSSLSSIGWVEGGADTVIDALEEILTPEGTLMMPAFNHGAVYAEGGIFDIRKTPTTNGKIPDTFWRREDVIRGMNPTHSFAAWGKDAAYFVTHDQEKPTMGIDSPLDRLAKAGGYVLLLGTGYRTNTFHHCVEIQTGAPCLDPWGEEYDVIDEYGERKRAHTWSWRSGQCPVCNQAPLYSDALDTVAVHGPVGNADAILYPMQKGFPLIAEVLHPYCETCSIRPRVSKYTIPK